MQEVPFERRINNSSIVVEGKVISQQSFWDKNRIHIQTANVIEVFKVFKGDVTGNQLALLTEGGVVGEDAQVVEPNLHLKTGDVGTFFGQSSGITVPGLTGISTVITPYAGAQAFIQYDEIKQQANDHFHKYQDVDKDVYKKITTKTGRDFRNLKAYSVADFKRQFSAQRGGVTQINSYTPPTSTAGTKTVLQISGSGFGTHTGPAKIEFTNASSGPETYSAAGVSEIISWEDSKIEVQVPASAGTGKIRITNNTGSTTEASQSITVPYSILNTEYKSNFYERDLVDDNNSGGYTFTPSKGFESNGPALAAFKRALTKWVCATRVNFILGPSSDVNADKYDNVNIIRFDSGNELPDGVLGWARSYSSGSGDTWWIKEIDFTFNDNFSWQYGPGNPSNSQYDFESVVLHEMGHAHELGHIINNKETMNRSISNGVAHRDLGSFTDIAGGKYVTSKSAIANTVGPAPMTLADVSACSANETTTGIEPGSFDGALSVSQYPNPVAPGSNTKIHVNLPSDGAVTCTIYNMMGQVVKEVTEDRLAGPSTIEIPSESMASGQYLYTVKFNLKTLSGKFTKLSTKDKDKDKDDKDKKKGNEENDEDKEGGIFENDKD
ncbi:MAG: hypothetical protein A3G23_07915 [Bacteroidetes bacterium RIFCSPLOWO2_12_FULL_37_12]|nr:MAG: hypothetical protein A3G23_07915 [Bacteroidetes bacterium RIFCSPLOWO2_12_FULL_37_12]